MGHTSWDLGSAGCSPSSPASLLPGLSRERLVSVRDSPLKLGSFCLEVRRVFSGDFVDFVFSSSVQRESPFNVQIRFPPQPKKTFLHYNRPLSNTGLSCVGPLIHGFFPQKLQSEKKKTQSALLGPSYPRAGGFPTWSFNIRGFNQPKVENSIFAFATADSNPGIELTVFDSSFVESVDGKNCL